MARHSGKNGTIKNGTDELDGLVSWDISEKVGDVDLSAAGDAWRDHDTTIKEWDGSITLRLDHEAAAKQTLRAGDVISFMGYTEGDGTGKTYYSGSATIIDHGIDLTYDGEVSRKYSFKGKGALSVAVVSP